jgi:tripartite-type tricarboxylate transporter receptor subunit TctC
MASTSLPRRTLLGLGAAASFSGTSRGQSILPDKGLRIVIGFAAGGGTDVISRLIAKSLERRLGRRVEVENRPGSAGALAGEQMKRTVPDGSTVAFLASTTLVSKLALPTFPFDPVSDVAPISLAGSWPMGFAVSPKLGLATFNDYLAWVKDGDAQRRKLGNTASDAFIQTFNLMTSKAMGISLEPVNYRGTAALVNDLSDGRLPAAASGIVSLLEQHRGGRLRLLMTTGKKRLAVAPKLPTARELGYPDLEVIEWFVVVAPKDTPEPVINEWNRLLQLVFDEPDLTAELVQLGLAPETSTPAAAAARIIAHQKSWQERMLAVGMQPMN